MHRWLLMLLMFVAAPAAAQTYYWNPAAEYVTAGQDEPGYRRWVSRASWRPVYVKAFNDYLTSNGVGGVVPTWQLLRTATDWGKCGAEPFEVPPVNGWPNIVAALRFVGAFVEPVIGPVEPVSVYRNSLLNACAGGAPESTHRTTGAIDMVPLRPVTREALMRSLCGIHVAKGSWNGIGLGFYKGLRFHIDAKKYREWGTAGCTSVATQGTQAFPVQPPATPPFSAKIIVPPPADPLAPRP